MEIQGINFQKDSKNSQTMALRLAITGSKWCGRAKTPVALGKPLDGLLESNW